MAIKKPLRKAAEPEGTEEPTAAETGSRFKKRGAGDGSSPRRSLSDAFDEAKPGGGFMPVGKHEVLITNFELEGEIADNIDEQKKLKAIVTYEGVPGEKEGVDGKELKSWYSLCDDNGEPQGGMGFIKKDLDVLGYDEVKIDDLAEVLQQITAERPKVIISVKQNGQYTNAYLQGLAEGE